MEEPAGHRLTFTHQVSDDRLRCMVPKGTCWNNTAQTLFGHFEQKNKKENKKIEIEAKEET